MIKLKLILIYIVFFAGIFFFCAGVSPAQQEPVLDLKTTVQKEVRTKKNGKWVMERMPVEETMKGDILVFTINYINQGKTDIVDVGIVNPIPQGVVYIPESAEGQNAEITCSIDNAGSWHKPPIMTRVKKPDGKEEIRPVPADQYTHIRWVIKKPILPGLTGRVSFKATVK